MYINVVENVFYAKLKIDCKIPKTESDLEPNVFFKGRVKPKQIVMRRDYPLLWQEAKFQLEELYGLLHDRTSKKRHGKGDVGYSYFVGVHYKDYLEKMMLSPEIRNKTEWKWILDHDQMKPGDCVVLLRKPIVDHRIKRTAKPTQMLMREKLNNEALTEEQRLAIITGNDRDVAQSIHNQFTNNYLKNQVENENEKNEGEVKAKVQPRKLPHGITKRNLREAVTEEEVASAPYQTADGRFWILNHIDSSQKNS